MEFVNREVIPYLYKQSPTGNCHYCINVISELNFNSILREFGFILSRKLCVWSHLVSLGIPFSPG